MSYNIVQNDGTLKNIAGGAGDKSIELTQAQYDTLVENDEVEKDVNYFIKDADSGEVVKTYTSLEELGLEPGCTTSEIFSAMENKTQIILGTSTSIEGDNFGNSYISDLPVTVKSDTETIEYGVLNIIKINESRFSITLKKSGYGFLSSNTMYIGNLKGSDPTNVIWNKVTIDTDFSDYQQVIDNSRYAQIGVQNGSAPGYLRQYNKPKKIVVIGNSITMHGRREADGIEWTVDDMREMAAQYPNSGWVSLLKRYISNNVNSECEVWKANGSSWEVQPNGTRKYSHMADRNVAQVFDSGPNYRPDLTINDILDENVDIVIIQLSENCSEPSTDAEVQTMATDFVRLYAMISKKCPKAKLYQFCGFWQNINKIRAMVGACLQNGVVPIQPFTLINNFNTSTNTNMQSSVGTEIYDGDGNVIATVSGAVASHPGDQGFQVMATYVINALYNEITMNSNQKILLFSRKSKYNEPLLTEFYNVDTPRKEGDNSLEYFNTYYTPFVDFFLTPGKYDFTAHYKSDSHGIVTTEIAELPKRTLSTLRKMSETEIMTSLTGSGYMKMYQHYDNSNREDSRLERKVILSATNTVFKPFYEVSPTKESFAELYEDKVEHELNKKFLGLPVYSFCYVITEDITVTNNNWTNIFNFTNYNAHIPKHILKFQVLKDTSTEITDYHSAGTQNDHRCIVNPNDSLLRMAAPTSENRTYKAGWIIQLEYTAR